MQCLLSKHYAHHNESLNVNYLSMIDSARIMCIPCCIGDCLFEENNAREHACEVSKRINPNTHSYVRTHMLLGEKCCHKHYMEL